MNISDERLREISQAFPIGDAGKMAQELLQRREAERKIDMLSDSIWIAGAKFGWNCGVVGDNNALQASIEGRIRERVKDKKECT